MKSFFFYQSHGKILLFAELIELKIDNSGLRPHKMGISSEHLKGF